MMHTPESLYQAAISHATNAQLEEGMRAILQAIESDPSNLNYHIYKGYIQYLSEDFEDALATYDKCLAANPTLENLWENRNLVVKKCAGTR